MSHNDSSISTREINKISRVSPYRNITPLLDVMSPQHYLVPAILVSVFVSCTPSVTHVLVLIPRSAPMPGNKAVRPTGPAPTTVFVLRALQLSVPWVAPAALRAMRQGPFRTIEERNAIQQAKLLAWFPDPHNDAADIRSAR